MRVKVTRATSCVSISWNITILSAVSRSAGGTASRPWRGCAGSARRPAAQPGSCSWAARTRANNSKPPRKSKHAPWFRAAHPARQRLTNDPAVATNRDIQPTRAGSCAVPRLPPGACHGVVPADHHRCCSGSARRAGGRSKLPRSSSLRALRLSCHAPCPLPPAAALRRHGACRRLASLGPSGAAVAAGARGPARCQPGPDHPDPRCAAHRSVHGNP